MRRILPLTLHKRPTCFLLVLLLFTGFSLSAQPDWDFAFPEGSSLANNSGEEGTKVAVDPYGDFFVTGNFGGNAFQGGVVTSNGNLDIFVAKYDYAGKLLWVSTIGTGNLESAGDIVYDPFTDRVVIIGTVQGDLSSLVSVTDNWLGAPNIGSLVVVDRTGNDIIVAAFDASTGAFMGGTVVGGSNNDAGYGITVDEGNGNIYITGAFRGTAIFGGINLTAMSGLNDDAFICAYNSSFTPIWGYVIGSAAGEDGQVSGRGIDFLGGRVAVTGTYENTISYQNISGFTNSATSAGNRDVFVAVYDGAGMLVGNMEAGGLGNDWGFGVGLQRDFDIFVTGYFNGSATFGTNITLASKGGEDIFVAKTAGGIWDWAVRAGSSGGDRAMDLTMTPDDNPMITGYIGAADAMFGSFTPTYAGGRDVVVAKFDQLTGVPIDVMSAGGSSGDEGNGIAALGDYAFVTGNFNSTDATFGTISTVASSSGTSADDIFVAGIFGIGPFEEVVTSLSPMDFDADLEWVDLDNDGDLDLIQMGKFGNPVLKIFDNTVSGLVEVSHTLVERDQGDIVLGDYDGDSFVDILLTGEKCCGLGFFTTLYHNDGGFIFTEETNASFAALAHSAADFGDYDNDGDLDLVLIGALAIGTSETHLYRNDGGGLFTEDFSQPFQPVDHGDVDWGDYDNDGDLDLALMGYSSVAAQAMTFIYQNVSGSFNDALAGLPGAQNGELEWGDYNGDGYLDLVQTGTFGGPTIRIWKNNSGTGTYTNVGAGLTGLQDGGADWGDFDNDGDLDLLVNGFDGLSDRMTLIYENVGADTFMERDLGFIGTDRGRARWGDFDNDGLLDVVVTGSDGIAEQAALYRNGGSYSQKSPPDVPGTATVSVNGVNATFSWSGVDTNQPQNSNPTYNLRISMFGGGQEIMPAHAQNPLDGTRFIVDIGNVGTNTKWTVNGLPAGTYFWGVQAINGAMQGGAFTTEQSFTVLGNIPTLGLIASYPFNGDANDEISGYNAIIPNPPATFENDRFGNDQTAIVANGSLNVNHLGGYTIGGDMAVTAWVKIDGLPTPDQTLIFQDDNGDKLLINASGELAFEFSQNGTTVGVISVNSNPFRVPLNVWTMVTVTRVAGGINLYINDDLVYTNALSRVVISGSQNAFFTGGVPGYGYIGTIDDIRIYNTGLPLADVQLLYSAGAYAGPQDFIAQWSNPNGDGYTDQTGNGNDLIDDGTPPSFTGADRFNFANEAYDFTAPQYLYSQNTNHPQGNVDVTYSLWEYHLDGNGGVLMQVGSLTSAGPGGQGGISLEVSNNTLQYRYGEGLQFPTTPVNLPANQWNHIALTKLSQTFTIYLNGQLVIQETPPTPPVTQDILNTDIYLGAYSDGSRPFTGLLDDMRIYNYDLADYEVLDVFNSGGNQSDINALTALYNATDGANWFDNTNWLTGSLDTWYGVTLDGSGRVSTLALGQNGLVGSIPPEIGNLDQLQYLYLWNNDFSGTSIPAEIGQLTNLLELDLFQSNLTGALPTELQNLTSLYYLSLGDNEFTGSIPSFLGNMPNLTDIYLWGNNLTGTIPIELGNLPNALWINLNANQLSGQIPPELGNLSTLAFLGLGGNSLTGTIPTELGNLINLTNLQLQNNLLDGQIPPELNNLSNLGTFILGGNNFTGSLPNLSNLTKLTWFAVHESRLTGDVPGYFANFSNLEVLSVRDNDFKSMPDVSGLTLLTALRMEGNKFTFEDIIPNVGVASLTTLTYSPQQDAGREQNVFIRSGMGESITVDLGFDAAVTGSNYDWYKDGTFVMSTSAPVTTFAESDVGTWTVEVINSSAPNLTLNTFDINVALNPLCVSEANFVDDSRIDEVYFNDIFNVSSSASDTNCATYTNFTNISTEVVPGQFVDIGITFGTCLDPFEKVAHFLIDWNRDGDFDDGAGTYDPDESVATAGPTLLTEETFFSSAFYQIPTTIAPGAYLLRVVVEETSDATFITGCGTYDYGETEDYTVNVIDTSPDLHVRIADVGPNKAFDPTTPIDAATETLNVSVTVSNDGLSQSPFVTGGLTFYGSQDQIFDTGDVLLASFDINVLGPGTIENQVDLTISPPQIEGPFYLFAVVDAADQVAETDENDNTDYVGEIYVTGGDCCPPTVVLNSVPPSYTLGSGGLTVQASISDAESGLAQVFTAFARISDVTDNADPFQYNVIIPTESSPGIFEFSLTDADFDEFGVQFYFVAQDNSGQAATSIPFPSYIRTAVANASFTSLTPTNADNPSDTDYNMFTVPLRNKSISDLTGIDTWATSDMRIFHYANGNPSELRSGSQTFTIGDGYWVIFTNRIDLNLDVSGEVVSVSNDNLFPMTLSTGWNQRGSPFLAGLDWNAVLTFNGVSGVSGLYFYNGGWSGENFSTSAFDGFFVENTSGGPVTLNIPLTARTNSVVRTKKVSKPIDEDDWFVNLNLSNGITYYNAAKFGMHPDADDGADQFDRKRIPSIENYLELNSKNALFKEKMSGDIVPTQDGYIWEYVAETSYESSASVLSWDNSTFGENDIQLVLYDVEKERIVNMRQVSEYNFRLSEQRKFRIFYGNEAFLKKNLEPARITLGNAYPNPFGKMVSIPFTLAGEGSIYTVKVSVYNSMGQEAKILLDNEPLVSGFHILTWDGTNKSGESLPEGIYIYRLSVSDLETRADLTGKMIFRK